MSNIHPVVAELQKRLAAQEAQTVPGAPVRTPKEMMLDATSTQKAVGPEVHVRWLNLRNPDKVAMRKAEGYVRVPESEGGKQIGDEMATFAISRRAHDARVAAQEAETQRRLKSHKTDMEVLAENTARILKDKHGLDVDPRRLFRDEGE